MTNPIGRLNVESVEPDYSNLSDHPYAGLMPMMSEEERTRQLATDIKRNGLQVRIDLFEGMILDGRNRYRALKALGIVPAEEHFKIFSGTKAEAEAYVISTNLHRRQLNNKQKQEFAQAMIAKYPDKSDFCTWQTYVSEQKHHRCRTRSNKPLSRKAACRCLREGLERTVGGATSFIRPRAPSRHPRHARNGWSVNLTQPIALQPQPVAGGSS
jgi:hypothetical protein